jgi:hypothetical protein
MATFAALTAFVALSIIREGLITELAEDQAAAPLSDLEILRGVPPNWTLSGSDASCATLGYNRLFETNKRFPYTFRLKASPPAGNPKRRAAVCLTGALSAIGVAYTQWSSSLLPILRGNNKRGIDYFTVTSASSSYEYWYAPETALTIHRSNCCCVLS